MKRSRGLNCFLWLLEKFKAPVLVFLVIFFWENRQQIWLWWFGFTPECRTAALAVLAAIFIVKPLTVPGLGSKNQSWISCYWDRRVSQAAKIRVLGRDRVCSMPLCSNISFLEVAHLIPFSRSGPPSKYNVAAMCPTCHALYDSLPALFRFILGIPIFLGLVFREFLHPTRIIVTFPDRN